MSHSLEPCRFCRKPFVERIAKNGSSPLEQHMKGCPSRNQSVTVSQTSTTTSTVVPNVASRCADLEERGSVGEHGVPIQTQQQPFIGCSSRDSAQGSGSPRLDPGRPVFPTIFR